MHLFPKGDFCMHILNLVGDTPKSMMQNFKATKIHMRFQSTYFLLNTVVSFANHASKHLS